MIMENMLMNTERLVSWLWFKWSTNLAYYLKQYPTNVVTSLLSKALMQYTMISNKLSY